MADPDGLVQAERIDCRQHIGPEADPVETQIPRRPRLAVPSEIGRQAVEVFTEAAGEREEHAAVEPRRVDEERRPALAAEVVQSERDAVGRRGSSRWHSPSRLPAVGRGRKEPVSLSGSVRLRPARSSR